MKNKNEVTENLLLGCTVLRIPLWKKSSAEISALDFYSMIAVCQNACTLLVLSLTRALS